MGIGDAVERLLGGQYKASTAEGADGVEACRPTQGTVVPTQDPLLQALDMESVATVGLNM